MKKWSGSILTAVGVMWFIVLGIIFFVEEKTQGAMFKAHWWEYLIAFSLVVTGSVLTEKGKHEARVG